MMPQLVTVRVDRAHGRPIRAWVPVLPAGLVLSPLLILIALAAIVACVIFRISVVRAFSAGWRLFCALPGARFDLHDGRAGVLVTIR